MASRRSDDTIHVTDRKGSSSESLQTYYNFCFSMKKPLHLAATEGDIVLISCNLLLGETEIDVNRTKL